MELARVARNAKDTFVFQVSEYKKKKYIDIRTFYTDDNGELQPTKKGINIPHAAFPAFLAAFNKMKEGLIDTGVFDAEDLEDEVIKEYL